MNISDDDINYLAKLSNFSVSEAEKADLKRDLSAILGYVKQLDEVNTDGVEPTYQVLDLQNVWQEDEIEIPVVTPEQLINLAPETAERQIKVPKVL